ncbi:hypothetical protein KUC_1483 [Vreelandella boliviensis LC1]|uniref:Uncharacterized protein n=1 Tax=Vreelandella boliviensis LC1 TaxID=1072583 RepID=A0A7U9C5L1_9GAMM|nr:hypothetical protein KUC_1483 [Halomonas boliviensis LC1]
MLVDSQQWPGYRSCSAGSDECIMAVDMELPDEDEMPDHYYSPR